MALTLPLTRFDTVVLKNKSGSDAAQVPAAGTFTFYRQGATVKTTTVLLPGFPDPLERTIPVENTGMFAAGDLLQIGIAGPTFTVTQVTTPVSLKILYTEQSSLQVLAGTRLIAAEITPFRDVLGKIPLTAPYVSDATTGRFGCYLDSARFDYRVAISGAGSRLYVDQFGGPETTFLPYLSARNFASLDDAIGSCPDGQETTIVLEPVTYHRATTLVIPGTKRVRLLGAGRDLTVIRCSDPLVDVVWVQGSHCTLESLTVEGPDTTALEQPELQGRGVVIGRLGEGASPVKDFVLEDVKVHKTASWAVWFIGWNDPGGVVNESLCLSSRLRRTELSDNQQYGLLKVGGGCTTLTFSGCALLRNAGYGALVRDCEQVTFLETVFEDSDDTKPYAEFANAFSCAMTQCWFEHRGGRGELRDSNTQRFVRVRNFCRSTTLLGCHFVRNAGPNQPFVGDPRAIEVSESTAFERDRARATSIVGCDYVVPGLLSGDDHILILEGSDVAIVGGYVQSADAFGNPSFSAPRVKEVSTIVSGVPVHGAWASVVGAGARIRVPRWRASDPNNSEADDWAAAPGDIRYDMNVNRLMLMTESGWRRLALEP